MRLRKNANIATLILRLEEQVTHAQSLIKDFKYVSGLLGDNKLGIQELNYNIDEDVLRFNHTHSKIEDLLKGL